jgi:hypothetical protein
MCGDAERIWCGVLHILSYHSRKKRESPEETLNRIFGECLSKSFKELARDRPMLSRDNLSPKAEEWPFSSLAKLQRKHTRTEIQGCEDTPIVVVRYRNRDCLIDGTKRINKWLAEGRDSPHKVYLLEVTDRSGC